MDASGAFGERLREARAVRGWSQGRLAAAAGVGIATVKRAENGYFEPRQETARRLAVALRVRAAWLMTGDGPMDAEEE